MNLEKHFMKIVFCECGSRTSRRILPYENTETEKLYLSGYFGKCNQCSKNLSPKRFWSKLVRGKPIEKRFHERYEVDKVTGCWNWISQLNKGGYGIITDYKTPKIASRISWELFNGNIPDGKVVCHKCDNRKCVNPSHLFIGSQKDNIHDAMEKGRFQRRERNGTAKTTVFNVREIRKSDKKFKNKKEEASYYGVSRFMLYSIKNNLTWKGV